jgi:hypothetical protein
MDRATELSFGLDTVRRSAEFKVGKLARRTGLLSLVGWLKNGGRDRLVIRVPRNGDGLVVEAVHSCEGEPALPWDLVDVRGDVQFIDCCGAAYGRALVLRGGSLRAQVTPNPAVAIRRGPAAPHVDVSLAGNREVIDLRAPRTDTTLLRPGRSPMLDIAPPAGPQSWSPAQRSFVEEARTKGHTIAAVYVPRWLGIRSSTHVLFDGAVAMYPFPAGRDDSPWEVTQAQIQQQADVLAASGVSRIIFSGGDEIHYRLMLALRERNKSIRFDMIFHGNFVQLQDAYVWKIFNLWLDASRTGLLHTFVTVKKGAELVLRAMGVRTELLLNYVPGEPMRPPPLPAGPPHVGIWTSSTFYKNVNPMLAALKLMDGAVLHIAGVGEQTLALAHRLRLPRGFEDPNPIRAEELPARIRQTHLSLYVTFAECSPMLPLESLQLGVPCLVGPACHLFEEDPYLFARLVVPFPDRPDVIAEYARKALEERDQIIDAWARYAPPYNERAKAMVRCFLAGHESPAFPYIEPSPLRPLTMAQEGDA